MVKTHDDDNHYTHLSPLGRACFDFLLLTLMTIASQGKFLSNISFSEVLPKWTISGSRLTFGDPWSAIVNGRPAKKPELDPDVEC